MRHPAASGPPSRPDDPVLADDAAAWRSAYVHIPFCARRCPYCDFAVVTPEEGGVDPMVARYVDAVVAEISMEVAFGPLDAVFVGGGTPSRLPASLLARVVGALRDRHGRVGDAEVSLEANPEDWTPGLAAGLVDAGFRRVSFGAQSFDAHVLSYLGRTHTPEDVASAVATARAAGFTSVNLDLIYGAPAGSATSWAQTVDRALALEPDHLSAYALTVERGTDLSRSVAAGAPAPDPDVQADAYDALLAAAGDAGLIHYEVSNFARPGHHVRYNLATWAQGEYIAFGLGAHDHRNGARRRNLRRLDRYLEAVEAGDRPRAGEERLDPWSREQERLMLGLRRVAGVHPGAGGGALLASPEGERLVDAGVLSGGPDRLRVIRPLLTDAVVRAVLDAPPALSLSGGEC